VSSGLLGAVRRSAPLLILSAMLPAGVVLVHAGSPAPAHTATASVYVATATSGDARALDAGAVFVQRQMSSYVVLAESSEVLDPVIARLATGETATRLARRLTVSVTGAGHLIEVSSSSSSAGPSTVLVTAVARSLADRVVADSPRDARGQPRVQAEVLGATTSTIDPQRPWRLAMLAALVGLAITGSLILYRYASVDRIATIDELHDVTSASVLARFPPDRRGSRGSMGPLSVHEMERLAVVVRAEATGGVLLMAETAPDQGAARVARGLAGELSAAGVECSVVEPAQSATSHASTGAEIVRLPTPSDVEMYVRGRRGSGHVAAVVRPYSRHRVDAPPALGATHGIVMVTLGRTSSAALVSALRSFENSQIAVVGLVVMSAPRLHSRFAALGSGRGEPEHDLAWQGLQPPNGRNGDQ